MDTTERFTGRADLYDRYRQRYPSAEVLQHLRDWCGLRPSSLVADIGAGTGMLSEVFLENGNPVIAIEPNAEMRAVCASLSSAWPLLTVQAGSAEATGLRVASVEIVAAGRAFHWFDPPRALAEFSRILKPEGWVVLVSLGRSHDDSETTHALEQVLHDYGTDYTFVRSGYRIHERMDEFLTRDLHQTQISSEQHLDWPGLLGQMLSLSVVPKTDDARYPAFEEALRSYFERFGDGKVIAMPTTCWITAGRLA